MQAKYGFFCTYKPNYLFVKVSYANEVPNKDGERNQKL